MIADIAELEEMDASEIHARRLNAKEVSTPKTVKHSDSRSRITVKLSDGNQVLRTSTLLRENPNR